MTKRLTITFLLSTILLLVSEYFLLHELYAEKRIAVLIVSVSGVIIGLAGIIKFYRQYKRFV